MQQKQFFFLSGIARSGSTLLGSILNQNPNLHVSPTSPVCDLFNLFEADLKKCTKEYDFDFEQVRNNLSHDFIHIFYKHINKPYIIDKHRAWVRNIIGIKAVITPNPKILCTQRPVAENVVSFLKLIKSDPNNTVDKYLRQQNLPLTTYNRAMETWKHLSYNPYESLKIGLNTDKSCIHIINYHNLINDPIRELKQIYDFLEIDYYENHRFDNIINTCSESKDEAWGFKNLHDIRPILNKTSDDPKEVLGEQLYNYFLEFDKQLKL